MRFILFILLLNIPSFAFSQELIISKVFQGEVKNTPGYNALNRSVFFLDSTQYHSQGKIMLEFKNLSIIPQSFPVRKSGISLYQNCESPCTNNSEVVISINRKLIRRQLFAQRDSLLNRQLINRFSEIYKASITRAGLILKKDSIYDLNLRSFSNWKEAGKYFNSEIISSFNEFQNTTTSPIIIGRLDREQKLALRSIENEINNAKRKSKSFKKFVKKGKGSPRLFTDNIWHLDFGSLNSAPEFHAYLRKGDFAIIQLDTLPTKLAERFIQIDSFPCVPVKRYLYYKELPGFDFKPSRYQNKFKPGSSIPAYRDFTLFFEHNKSEYDRSDVEPILEFLQDSSYIVQQAKVHGLASVEGDSINNQRLQEERARILIDLIQKEQAEDSIELVEITTAENWDMFFEQIEKSEFESWQEKSKTEIKSLLEDDSIALLLEPILAPERFSKLQLKLRIKLDDEQKAEFSYRAFRNALDKYYSSSSAEVRKSNLLRAAQIRSYVRDAYRAGEFEGDPCRFFDSNAADLDILHFYEMRYDLKKGLEPICMEIKDIVFRAHQNIIFKLSTSNKEQYPTLLRQAIDIQNYIFDGLLDKSLSATFFDLLNYPRNKRFHYLILNSYYFKNYVAQHLIREYNMAPVNPAPRVGYPVKNTFYYILKEIVLNDEFEMIKRSPGYFEFELYDFLSFYSVDLWDPVSQTFFDEEVDDKVMKEQLNRLMSLNSIICDRQVFQLYLDFHNKAAYHNYLASGPDNRSTLESLTRLYQYFYSRKEKLDPESSKKIALTLLWYARESYNKDLVQYAYDILESQFTRKRLDSEGNKLFMEVLSLFPSRSLPGN